MKFLKGKSTQAVILGFTEIPLAITKKEVYGLVTINLTNMLTRALIYDAVLNKLK